MDATTPVTHPHGTLDVGLPPGPNFFGYGEPGYAKEMLGRAGFVDISINEVPLVWMSEARLPFAL